MVEIPLTSYIVDGQTKWTLMSERKTVTKGGRSPKCNYCDYIASHINNLATHMRRHNSEKLFKCDQCTHFEPGPFCGNLHIIIQKCA